MNNAVGYVQNLSPTKKGKRRKISYFDFMLQTSEHGHSRAVCFQESLKASFESYQGSGIPVKIRNVSRKPNFDDPSNLDIIVNNRSTVEMAATTDVDFESASPPQNAEAPEYLIQDIPSVEVGQLLTVKGMLNMDTSRVRTIERNGIPIRLLDACTITDNTGKISNTY